MKKLICLAVAALALVSCERAGVFRHRISIRVLSEDTRGTVTTTESLVKKSGVFAMDAYITDDYIDSLGATQSAGIYIESNGTGNVRVNGTDWIISGGKYYWISGTPINFWAWHPVTTEGNRVINPPATPAASEITFSYTAPFVIEDGDNITDADNTEDILFAFTSKVYDGRDVDIRFRHALAQVRFCVSTNDGTFDPGLEISKISISGLYNSGSATYSDTGDAVSGGNFDWTSRSGSGIFVHEYGARFTSLPVEDWTAGTYTSGSNTYDLHTCQNVFFMIPQTVTSSNEITIEFKYKGVTSTVTKPIAVEGKPDTWLSGCYYTYKIKATTLNRDIDASVELVGWSNRDDKIII